MAPMFKIIRPCSNCPFRKGQGKYFGFSLARLKEIVNAPAFQCHKTVDYENWDNDEKRSGDNPQQCAGLMSVLAREGKPNQIMQVGERFGHFDPSKLDPQREAYASLRSVYQAHTGLGIK